MTHRQAHGMTDRRILVAGLGNELLMDDGVGVHAVRALTQSRRFRPRESIRCLEVGTAVLDAVEDVAWAGHVLLLDAVQTGGSPGSCCFVAGNLEPRNSRGGLHELSLVGTIALLGPSHVPPTMSLIGIEPERIEYGLELSLTVARTLPSMVNYALVHLERLRKRRLGDDYRNY